MQGYPLVSILEHKQGKLAQASAPRLPFVSRLGGHIEMGVDPRAFERFNRSLWIATPARSTCAKFMLTKADENQFVQFLERLQIG